MAPAKARRWRAWLAFLLAVCVSGQAARAADPIVPLRQRVFLSSHPRWSRWSVPLRSAQGATVYEMSLEPQVDRQRHVTGVTLRLRYPGDAADARNLLEPDGNWHGMQAFDFPARDLAAGIDGSSFGRARKIFAARVGLVVRVVLLEVQVRSLKKNEFELDKLSLDIEVDNPPR